MKYEFPVEELAGYFLWRWEWNFIVKFATETDFSSSEARIQLRCLWTALCFHHGYDVDTKSYDELLSYLWDTITSNAETAFEPGVWNCIEDFDVFMCENLV